jgi:caffeoyl-CoA O-methyltransferase
MNDSSLLYADNPILVAPVDPGIERYMRTLVGQASHEVVIEMEDLAKKMHFPIVERLVGHFLLAMAKSINARHIFEFGSGYGYSAFWFANAVGEGGRVVCTDGDLENKDNARRFLMDAGLWDKIEFHVGNAQSIFHTTEGLFDICYNDADKGDYPEIWRLSKNRIRPGGLYIADNTLWHGRVILDQFEDVVPGWTEAIREHNELIFNDPDFDAFINPTRDGVLVARRK